MTYDPVKSIPTVRVYRTPNDRKYMFMELAEADPGHYVGYGELRTMEESEAKTHAMAFVVGSLRTFFSRDGLDKSRRLNMKPYIDLISVCDLVITQLVSESILRFIPFRRGEVQNERLNESKIDLPIDAPRDAFFMALDKSFSAAMKANEDAEHRRSS